MSVIVMSLTESNIHMFLIALTHQDLMLSTNEFGYAYGVDPDI